MLLSFSTVAYPVLTLAHQAGDKVTSHVSGSGGRTCVFHPRVYTPIQARANGAEDIRLQFQE